MEICKVAACVMAVAFGVSPLVYGAASSGGAAASVEAGWTNGFDLAGGTDAGPLVVSGGWTNGYDLSSGGDPGGLLVVGGWTSGYDLPSSGDKTLSAAIR